jgi:hypothetical protein
VLSATPGREIALVSPAAKAGAGVEWQKLQKELTALSTDSKQVVSTNASHTMPTDDPALIIESVLGLLKRVQAAPR